MKLLIVEDERMTREGLTGSLDWAEIGISKVFCAENGEAGLYMAKRMLPDIVLTDIRMPRMDGITMAGHIREILPECRIIFLSAYSEIDYYKAAIDLKAISYLDKPVEVARLQAVIEEAVSECQKLRKLKSTGFLEHIKQQQKFADAICIGEDEETLETEYESLNLSTVFKKTDYCTAVIINLRLDFDEETQDKPELLAASLSEAAAYPNIYTIRHGSRIVLLLFSPHKLSDYNTQATCRKLQNTLGSHIYAIAVGKPYQGLKNAHKSYVAAKAVLEKTYLYPWRQVVYYGEETTHTVGIFAYAEQKSEILNNVSESNEQGALEACGKLYKSLRAGKDLTFNQARELYFEIISEIFHIADLMHLQIKEAEVGEGISWIVLIESYNLDELHDFLCRHISFYFKLLENTKDEKKQVLAIKNYVAKNFMRDTLSIGDISDYLHMSASHICTIFKKETGTTINNYLTEYRLSKAKQYLRETLLTVADISVKVGYRDNSYFGRLFRKHVGMTPNEYRNR